MYGYGRSYDVREFRAERPEWQGPDGADGVRFALWADAAVVAGDSPGDRRRFALIVAHPDYRGLERQIFDVGGCEHPIRLRGESVRRLVGTGEIVSFLSSKDAPAGLILVRCMNRRASRCASCSRLYRGDTFQLVRAGIAGGKGVPVSVAGNPQAFATFTAPSFGAVHKAGDPGEPGAVCKRMGPGAKCPHGRRRGCLVRHEPGDVLVGQALCPECYDYAGQVLWNWSASRLWKAFTDNLYHHLAVHAGVSAREIRRLVRVEYVKVAEYQRRGAVHFHAQVRLDGAEGVGSVPAAWASHAVLCEAVESAARVSSVRVADGSGGEVVCRFGRECRARAVFLDGVGGLLPSQVAGYLAKYVSKGTEDAHGLDVPVSHASQIEDSGATGHVRALMRAAWRLGSVAEREGLRRWCHMLGFGGHVLTCSRGFSVTRGGLRRVREEFKAGPVAQGETYREGAMVYAGRGYGDQAVEELAADIRADMEDARRAAAEAGDAR